MQTRESSCKFLNHLFGEIHVLLRTQISSTSHLCIMTGLENCFCTSCLNFQTFFRGLRPLTLEDSQVYSKNFPLGVFDGKNALPKHVPNSILQRTTS